ncbi:MAG: hypothetical protein FJ167_07615 [Gammaproteobacteria bacterium]|nr:hypothetical protein [Gammaproteobacteria bacterium]
MADYFTNFSLQVRLPDEAAQAYALELHRQGIQLWQGDEVPADYPAELREHHEDWCFEVEADVVENQPGIWLHSSNGGIDAVCAFLQHLLQRFKLKEAVTFEWSHDCSKPRTDAYGGGAAVITANEIKTMSTSHWLQDHTASPLN